MGGVGGVDLKRGSRWLSVKPVAVTAEKGEAAAHPEMSCGNGVAGGREWEWGGGAGGAARQLLCCRKAVSPSHRPMWGWRAHYPRFTVPQTRNRRSDRLTVNSRSHLRAASLLTILHWPPISLQEKPQTSFQGPPYPIFPASSHIHHMVHQNLGYENRLGLPEHKRDNLCHSGLSRSPVPLEPPGKCLLMASGLLSPVSHSLYAAICHEHNWPWVISKHSSVVSHCPSNMVQLMALLLWTTPYPNFFVLELHCATNLEATRPVWLSNLKYLKLNKMESSVL